MNLLRRVLMRFGRMPEPGPMTNDQHDALVTRHHVALHDAVVELRRHRRVLSPEAAEQARRVIRASGRR